MAAVGSGINGGVVNGNTTSSLSPEVATYYEKVFLARTEYDCNLEEGSQKRTHPANEGRTVNFTRRLPLGIVTSPIGELSNPVTCAITACTVAMTLSEYGLTVTSGKLITLTGIDSNMKETVELIRQNKNETLNRLVRTELANGTSYFGNNHTVHSFTSGDTMDACDIRMMTRTLENNKAIKYPWGGFMGKTDAYSKFNLLGDSTWVNAKTYSDVKDLYKGEMGELFNVRWILNLDDLCGTEAASTAGSAVARHYTFVRGADAFGVYDLAQDQPRLYILPNQVDSGSPAGRVSYVSWAGSFATKILNSDWVLAARFSES